MKIALTGGIACGKSLFARYLSQLRVCIIDADDVVHELEAPGGEAVVPIVKRFGESVRDAAGGIDRVALAKLVFSASGSAACPARADLESILFPLVRKRIDEFFANAESDKRQATSDNPPSPRFPPSSRLRKANQKPEARNQKPCPAKIAIIPLLFESHWDTDYDIIVSLVSEREAQIRRMAETRGQSREEAEARIDAQMPVAEKAARAHYVIRNDSTPDALRSEAERLVEWLESKTRG
jgi:dephospho-CoA kinase